MSLLCRHHQKRKAQGLSAPGFGLLSLVALLDPGWNRHGRTAPGLRGGNASSSGGNKLERRDERTRL